MKDNSTGKDKEFYELGKKIFDRLNPPQPKQLRDKTRANTAEHAAEAIEFLLTECDALHKEIDPANAYQKGWDDAMFRNSLGKNK